MSTQIQVLKGKNSGVSEPPINYELTFKPYIRFLQNKRERVHDIRNDIYDYIIKSFESNPKLLQPIADVEDLKAFEDQILLIKMSMLPIAGNSEDYLFGMASIYPFNIFYYTKSFQKILFDNQAHAKGDEEDELKMIYQLILDKCYNIGLDSKTFIVKSWYDEDCGQVKYYKVKYNSNFIDITHTSKLPELKGELVDFRNIGKADIKKLKEILPLKNFKFSGFIILNLEEDTIDESISTIKNAVLNLHTQSEQETFNEIESGFKTLLGTVDLRVGIMPLLKVNDEIILNERTFTHNILISKLDDCDCYHISYRDIAKRFSQNPKPLLVADVNDDEIADRPYLQVLKEEGIGSYLIIPIMDKKKLLGVLEIGAKKHGFLNYNSLSKIGQALPIMADLLYFLKSEFDEKIENFIKDKFTSLQPAVQWKFNEIAWQYLKTEQVKNKPLPNIIFEDVYPLYGAIDIRNSSVERVKATQADLINHLKETQHLLEELSAKIDLPILERLQYKCVKLQSLTHDAITSEAELKINDFLYHDVYTFFDYLKKIGLDDERIAAFKANEQQSTGKFHENRRAYEESLTAINSALNTYLEGEKDKLQSIYPHYFEKYRTDGVEYSIYIGQSIAPQNPFDLIYLKNLQLWQITSMVELARLTKKLKPNLAMDLQTTQLILAQSAPISISFRRDERQFDVEGSYNIRYEIIKKRIDKVKLMDSDERLTQPDKIAIVYTNQKEADDYLQYIDFAVEKGLLLPDVEQLELEELQGVSGLKAIRVTVNYN